MKRAALVVALALALAACGVKGPPRPPEPTAAHGAAVLPEHGAADGGAESKGESTSRPDAGTP